MDITVTFQDGVWKTDPHPAIVMIGTKVRWILRAPLSKFQELRWHVDFEITSPFGSQQQLSVETKNTGLGNRRSGRATELSDLIDGTGLEEDIFLDHRGTTELVSADEPGEYKYDLRVENAENEELVGEEDPVLVVLRGPIRIWV